MKHTCSICNVSQLLVYLLQKSFNGLVSSSCSRAMYCWYGVGLASLMTMTPIVGQILVKLLGFPVGSYQYNNLFKKRCKWFKSTSLQVCWCATKSSLYFIWRSDNSACNFSWSEMEVLPNFCWMNLEKEKLVTRGTHK